MYSILQIGRLKTTKLNATGTAIVYSTYLGGAGRDEGKGIAVDTGGSAYVAGSTESSNFPTQGAVQGSLTGFRDAFISKLSASGNAFAYSTYFGGSSFDHANAIAIDTAGNAYVTGTTSGGLTTIGAAQGTFGGFNDAFVTKLNAAGSAHIYTTYLGGAVSEDGNAVAVTAVGEATIVGATTSSNLPVFNAVQSATASPGIGSAFVARLNATGSAFLFSTYLGGIGGSSASAVAIAPNGNTYVAGTAYSADFPVKNAAQPVFGGRADAFVTAFNPAGTQHLFSTFIGGSGIDFGNAITATASRIAVAGSSGSANFPLASSLRSPLSSVYRSSDSGSVWTPSPFPGSAVAIATDPSNPAVAYVATAGAIYRTTDGGATWSLRTSAPLAGSTFTSLAVDPGTPCRVSAGMLGNVRLVSPPGIADVTGPTFAESLDCGATWSQQTPTPSEFYRVGIAYAPTAPSNLYWVGGGTQVIAGSLFEVPQMCRRIGANSVCTSGPFSRGVIAVDPANPCITFHASTNAFGSLRGAVSRNTSCSTLSYQSFGTLAGTIQSLAHHPTDGQTLVAGLADGRLYRKIGAGAWTLSTILDGGVSGLAFGSDGTLYAATRAGSVYKSSNAGVSFVRTAYAGSNLGAIATQSSVNVWTAASEVTDAFVTMLDSAGAITYSTLHGGTGNDVPRGIVLRGGEQVIVAGETSSANFPIAGGGYGVNHLGMDAFVARFDPATAPPALSIVAPTPNQSIPVNGVTFQWTQVSSATGYNLQITRAGTAIFQGSLAGVASTSTLVSLSAGDYTFAVRDCSGGFAPANCGPFVSVNFTVAPTTPAQTPVLGSPTNGQNFTSSTQTFSWSAVAGAVSYEVQLVDLITGITELTTAVFGSGGNPPATNTVFTMRPSSSYRLQVRACIAGCGAWSAPVNFSVTLPPVPTVAPNAPSCAVSSGNRATCSWNAVPNADFYIIQLIQFGIGPGGSALTVSSVQVSETSVAEPNPLLVPSGSTAAIVAGCNGGGCGPYGVAAMIAVPGPNPSAPTLGNPVNRTSVLGPDVFFSWNRIPGDTGSTVYRLYVQDFVRGAPALDVYTTSNFYAARFKADGSRYDAVVVADPDLASQIVGPPAAFIVRGGSPQSPTMVQPAHQATGGNKTSPRGNVQLGWTPVPGATLYEYFVAVSGQSAPSANGVTPGLVVQVPLGATGSITTYSGIVRACPAGATCTLGSDGGWGPWSNAPGQGGVTTFRIAP